MAKKKLKGPVTQTVLYDGDVTLEFESARHIYKVDGEIVPSVTKVLNTLAKPALVPWAARMSAEDLFKTFEQKGDLDLEDVASARMASRRYTQERQAIGTEAHQLIEQSIRNEIAGEDPEMKTEFASEEAARVYEHYRFWRTRWPEIKMLFAERKVMSRQHFVCGTLDIGAEGPSGKIVIDIKTGKNVYPEHGMQLAAYLKFLHEEFPGDGWGIGSRAILSLPAGVKSATRGGFYTERKVQKITGGDVNKDYAAFINLLAVTRWKDGNAGWRKS